ncbi:N(2)-fixation sustaining protein CowN [Pararhodospirillum oryzae]|uniref:N(2)-fixation sustaining protein CowN n=1 Tax=Pararhodospirillum oryzae TaxID=478448 RepID=A0A512HB47_9PROT|nr:N(2)-fixation sustaining protein CowN [Pararhodospirillum oryzae]GEO82669.1 hypothetical protein ROR02_28000 [Pararhodospirillum oryzae]
MTTSSSPSPSSPSGTEGRSAYAVPERYVSFRTIDFEGNMRRVMDHLQRYIDDPEHANALWERFKTRLAQAEQGENAITDKLLLLHSHVYYMVELFEDQDDEEALAALKKLEEECF